MCEMCSLKLRYASKKTHKYRLRIGDEFISNKEQVANTFNIFFTEIGAPLANRIKVIGGANYNQYRGNRFNQLLPNALLYPKN